MSSDRPKTVVIYHFFPHYRAPVMRALALSERYAFEFWGAHRGVDGIPVFCGDQAVAVHEIGLAERRGSVALAGWWRPVLDPETKALIILGNPNIRATWIMALAGRLLGKRVLFWAHGWLKPEPPLKAWVRNLYFGLADRVLVYGDRARSLGAESGFNPRRIVPIYNSLDWEASKRIYEALTADGPSGGEDSGPIRLICTARLTPVCRFDLLLEAMMILKAEGRPARLTLVGDGPERERLEQIARNEDLDVTFAGAIYDETRVAALIYMSDFTVSPGKVGLTALHSLSYGCPVITHDDFDQQMPEVEVIIPGKTGSFFRNGDAADLAHVIAAEADRGQDRAAVRQACREAVAERWTATAQLGFVETALNELNLGS